MQLQELRDEPLPDATPAGFSLDEVEVRLARPDERIKWDVLMDQHHYLGFKRFAGRGLRYVAEWRGRWIALAGWQAAALKCAARDRWIGWRGKKMFKRLHLIANNTRFLVLGERGVFANLGSCMLSAMLRRLSDDWLQQYGHPLLVVEALALDCYSLLRNPDLLGKVMQIRHLLEFVIFLPMPLPRARWA